MGRTRTVTIRAAPVCVSEIGGVAEPVSTLPGLPVVDRTPDEIPHRRQPLLFIDEDRTSAVEEEVLPRYRLASP